jgi:hypothetical protein
MNTSLILNSYKSKVKTPDELLARILDAAACIKKREYQLRKKNAIFAHELQSARKLTVGFANIYCEL